MLKKKLSIIVCAMLLAVTCVGLVACGNNDGEKENQTPLHDSTKWFTEEELSAKGLAGLTAPTGLSGEMNTSDAWYNDGYSFSQACPEEKQIAHLAGKAMEKLRLVKDEYVVSQTVEKFNIRK